MAPRVEVGELTILCNTQYCVDDMVDQELLASLRQELKRGSVVLVCLLSLRTADYGYSLLKTLEEAGVDADANTLYPLLRRLERQGLVTSEWLTDEPRPRKFYRTSPSGREMADALLVDWAAIGETIKHFQRGEEK
jgi:DNA-binding PadR family transcriptional regulator